MSIRSSFSFTSLGPFSPSTTPTSSADTTPSSSPPEPSYFSRRITSISFAGISKNEEEVDDYGEEVDQERKLRRTQPDTLKCSTCATDVAFAEQIVSKGFTGRHGRAYLVSPAPLNRSTRNSTARQPEKDKDKDRDLINVRVGRTVNRQLVTGAHVVADISCTICGTVLGWKYVDAKEASQKYKIGKFILETKRVVSGKAWEDVPDVDSADECSDDSPNDAREEEEEEEVEFDSGDEDECEDLFAGVWDAEAVAKRRSKQIRARKRTENGA